MGDIYDTLNEYEGHEQSVIDCTAEIKKKKEDANASLMDEINESLIIAKSAKYKDFNIIMENYHRGKDIVEDVVRRTFVFYKKNFVNFVSANCLEYIPGYADEFLSVAENSIMESFRTYKTGSMIDHFNSLMDKKLQAHLSFIIDQENERKKKKESKKKKPLPKSFWDYSDEDVTEEKMKEFYQEFQTGEIPFRRAKEDACLNLHGFIMYIIMHSFWTYCKSNFSDLLQCGFMGVMNGMEYYNPEKAKPTTFFKTYIKSAISRHITSFLNNTTVHYASTLGKINKAVRFFESNGISYNDITIAEYTGLSLVSVKEALASKEAAAFSNYQDELKNSTTESGYSSFSSQTDPEKDLEEKELKRLLVKAFNYNLSEVERQVIAMHYGLEEDPKAFKDIGKALGISTNEVKMHHQHALSKLATDELNDYYNGTNDAVWTDVKSIFLPEPVVYQEEFIDVDDFVFNKQENENE